MLYNILVNYNLKRMTAIPADEGLPDIVFDNGWRIVLGAIERKRISTDLFNMSIDDWRRYIANLMGDDWIMADDDRFVPYVEDVPDQLDEEDQWMELDDPSDNADSISELGPDDQKFDMVETFHFLNNQ